MAEQVTIFEVDISIDKVVKDIETSKKLIAELKNSIKELTASEDDNTAAIVEKTAMLKAEESELRTNQNITKNIIIAKNNATGSINQLRAQLAIVSNQWNILSKDERENTDVGKNLSKQKLELTNKLKQQTIATGDARINVGHYTESIKEAFGSIGQLVPAVGQASSGIGTMATAFKLALGPIGWVMAAIGLVTAAFRAFFTSSEEGQNQWAKIWSSIQVIIGNIIDLLASLGKALLEPQKILEGMKLFFQETFGKIIVGTIQLAVEKIKKYFNEMNLSWQELKDKFVDNAEGIKKAQNDIAINNKKIGEANTKVNDGVNNIAKAYNSASTALSDYLKEQERELKISQDLQDKQAKVDKSIRSASIANAKDLQDIADLRNKVAQKEKFTNQESLQFLDEAIEKETQILKRNEQIAAQKLYIKQEQNKLANSNKEALDEEAALLVDLINLRTNNLSKTKELESQRVEFIRAIESEEKSASDAKRKRYVEQLREEALAAAESLQIELDAIEKSEEFDKKMADFKAEKRQIESDAKFAAAKDDIFRITELERAALKQKQIDEITFANELGADTKAIKEKYVLANREIDIAEQNAKLALFSNVADAIISLAGEGTAAGKAAAVAQTTISTYVAAQAAFAGITASTGGWGIAAAIAAAAGAVAFGIANVKKILAVPTPGGGSGGGSIPTPSSGGGGGSTPNRPLSFAPNVNQGIVSRQSNNTVNNAMIVQPTLIIDDVTNNQNRKAANGRTSVI